MTYIVLTGWQTGFQKVSLTKLQINLLNMKLVESKKNVDNLLDGYIVIIKEKNKMLATEFIEEAQKIGVICHYSSDLI